MRDVERAMKVITWLHSNSELIKSVIRCEDYEEDEDYEVDEDDEDDEVSRSSDESSGSETDESERELVSFMNISLGFFSFIPE